MAHCPICDANDVRPFYRYATFELVCCAACDLVFQQQIEQVNDASLIDAIYDQHWIEMRDQYAENTFREHASFNVLLLEICCQQKGRLLEIGSGTGEFLFLAREAGWSVTGVEPSADACAYAKNRYQLDLIHAMWDHALAADVEPFDAIAFWHVFEHIRQPKEFLTQMRKLLKPGGLLLMSVPNRNSLTNKIYRELSPLFVEVDHLFHYSSHNLQMLLEQCGLTALSLFSREEQRKLESDLHAAGTYRGTEVHKMSIAEKMKAMVQLQAQFEGHEIVCIATAGGTDEKSRL